MKDVGPALLPGRALIEGRAYIFVRHAGEGRSFSGVHAVPSSPLEDRKPAMTLCGRVSRHGWETCAAEPPDSATASRWCHSCADALLESLEDAVDRAVFPLGETAVTASVRTRCTAAELSALQLPDPPVLLAYRRGPHLYCWCPWCARLHCHGWSVDLYRRAHCYDRASPFHVAGYRLQVVGALPPWLWQKHLRRLGCKERSRGRRDLGV